MNSKDLTLRESIVDSRNRLSKIYPHNESSQIISWLYEKLFGYSQIELIQNDQELLSIAKVAEINENIKRLLANEPIQYVLGKVEFYNIDLTVNSSVLIPRPETEELVDWILSTPLSQKRVLDIGTGSGAIAISLAKNSINSEIVAVDISEDALSVARGNAKLNGVDISFMHHDILKWRETDQFGDSYDIVVSNPPYVKRSEISEMRSNVLNYEPDGALFVSDDDPLIFYREIALMGTKYLKQGGELYFEINQQYGDSTVDLLKSLGYGDIEVRKDLFGVDRMTRAIYEG